jgi:hypothetical protein
VLTVSTIYSAQRRCGAAGVEQCNPIRLVDMNFGDAMQLKETRLERRAIFA